MSSVSLELQGAIVARLVGFAPLTALIADRVYDAVPDEAVFPYISVGPDQIVSDDAECLTAFEVFLQLDAWSRTEGRVEVKRVAEAVRLALHGFDLSLTDNALLSIEHRQTRILPDPDGQTSHAVIEFVALVEQP
ncbi:DUF3168 domain-containing protein [Azospirillum sp.]|uniref:DUF3168 domain-containing protein n=1 Tax=Azospirillum sp. TaxID=34012 RepID=UPI002D3E3608|nr:DUF3168 domain-containing protein [Azospirillum sp.]HYD66170.1 DUF3168 domain-containing protein [Azospirillum sp.]